MINDIMQGLNDMQKEAVCHKDGSLLILAGAGSGKTSVITRRIAKLIETGVMPYNIMAITFTNKAAKEMKDRVSKILDDDMNSVFVSTFHSACVRFLRRDIDRIGYGRDFTIYDTTDAKSVVKACIKKLDLDPKVYKERSILSSISGRKNRVKSATDKIEFGYDSDIDRNMDLIYKEYQKRLRQNNALDFDDLILKTVELLQNNEDIREYYANRFKYIMVDEYQDTNNSQFELIRLLAIHKNLCVVGDDDQSIYRFRGANIANILNFEKHFENTKIIKLEQNYRSTSQILDCANAVVSHNTARKNKKLWTDNKTGSLPEFWHFETGYDEANFVIGEIRDLVAKKECKYSDFAILYRANSQSRLFEEKAVFYNIPYRLIGGVNFYARAEIKDILAYLRVLVNQFDDVSLQRIINVPKRGIGNTTITKLMNFAIANDLSLYQTMMVVDEIPDISGKTRNLINDFCVLMEDFRKAANTYKVKELIEFVCEKTGYIKELEAEMTDEANGRIENIGELLSKALDYDENNDIEGIDLLSGFLEDVALIADVDNLTDDDYIVMMTLHGSKGLEFDRVYLTGMEQGMFPSYFAIDSKDEKELEEERRLCYVGITRAKKILKLTSADRRIVNGQTIYSKPSCFVEEIPDKMLNKMGPVGRTSSLVLGGNFAKQAGNGIVKNKIKSSVFLQQIKPNGNKPEKKLPDYSTGERVRHMKYGEGVVSDITDIGRDYQVTVDFDNFGRRILLAGFAKLAKI